MERIILAFDGEKTRRRLLELFASSRLGATACATGGETLTQAAALEADLVICGVSLPDMGCEQLRRQLPARCAMLVLAAQEQLDQLTEPELETLSAPVRGSDLIAAVQSLLRRHNDGAHVPKRTDEERALITQAKALLMERCFMTEAQAHRFLQRYSMDTGSRMVDAARRLLDDPESIIPPAFFET